MKLKRILEIAVQTVEAAIAAERGGADRIELSAELPLGGVTPSAELLRAARNRVSIPIFSMIRPRGGDFVYSAAEFSAMKNAIATAKELGMNGVVLGILRRDGRVDIERTRELIELAKPLPVTFHRAFDACPDFRQALEDVIRAGATRILTSGGAPTAAEGAAVIAELVQLTAGRIVLLPGGGILSGNALEIVRRTDVREIHAGLSSVLAHPQASMKSFLAEVERIAVLLSGHG